MWFKFTKDFDFRPAAKGGRVTVAYRAGMTQNVTQEAAAAAEAAGAGKPVKAVKSDGEDS